VRKKVSSSLVTSFNHFGLCASYDKHGILTLESSGELVLFPSHVNESKFTMGAFDNFDHDQGKLSGIGGSHDNHGNSLIPKGWQT